MKYHPFLMQLRVSGWNVAADDLAMPEDWFTAESLREMGQIEEPCPPIFTLISGHMGSLCREDLRGFDALGIRKEDLPDLMRDLHRLMAQHLHICMSSHARGVRQESRASTTTVLSQGIVSPPVVHLNNAGVVSAAAATPAHANGIG
jgi:hypothetical protein